MLRTAVHAETTAQPQVDSFDTLLRQLSDTRPGRIMIVDDEPLNIRVVRKYLSDAGYEDFITTADSTEALDLVRATEPDVLLLDIMMPDISGMHILEVIRGDVALSHIPVLFLTAARDEETKQRALELGVTDFLNKPVHPTDLIPRVKNAVALKAHHDQMLAYSKRLEYEVKQRTRELEQSREDLLHVLATAAEYRDRETGNHVLRVGRYAGIIARAIGLGQSRCTIIEQAAILHDVGKIGITDLILLKPGKLDPDEITEMQRHCEYGLKILLGKRQAASHGEPPTADQRGIDSPMLNVAAKITMSHHEKWDGTGYPLGLKEEAIPIEGRITAVADVFDALSTKRPYKDPIPLDRCFEMLIEGRGTHFDPRILDAFLARRAEVARIALELAD